MSKYIQSFYQYPVTFSSTGITVPARGAQGPMKNIAEVSDKEYERMMNAEPLLRELINKQKYRVLNHIPASYIPANEQVNKAKAEAEELRKKNEELQAKLAAATAEKSSVTEPEEKEADEKPVEKKPAGKKK